MSGAAGPRKLERPAKRGLRNEAPRGTTLAHTAGCGARRFSSTVAGKMTSNNHRVVVWCACVFGVLAALRLGWIASRRAWTSHLVANFYRGKGLAYVAVVVRLRNPQQPAKWLPWQVGLLRDDLDIDGVTIRGIGRHAPVWCDLTGYVAVSRRGPTRSPHERRLFTVLQLADRQNQFAEVGVASQEFATIAEQLLRRHQSERPQRWLPAKPKTRRE